MKVSEWKTYRTRFLVKAKQLNSSLSFTDHLGRQHCGRKGDYLVESFDGVLSIAPRRIFEDIYVPMMGTQESGGAPGLTDVMRPGNESENADSIASGENELEPCEVRPLDLPTVRVEPLAIERIKPEAFEYGSRDSTRPRSDVTRARRKSPMSVSSTATRVRLM